MTNQTSNGNLLDVNNIEVVYNDIVQVLRGVSLSVAEGSIVALLGTNGAGKTTIMKMLTGYLEPTSGNAEASSYLPSHQDFPGELDRYLEQVASLLLRDGRCDGTAVAAGGGERAVKPGDVDPRRGNQGGKTAHEFSRCRHKLRLASGSGLTQLVDHHAVWRQRHAARRERRACTITQQTAQASTILGGHRNVGVQGIAIAANAERWGPRGLCRGVVGLVG